MEMGLKVFLFSLIIFISLGAVSGQQRVQTGTDYSYSAVVTSNGTPQAFEYTVRNPSGLDKPNMETRLSGVNASFLDGSDSKSYSLPSGDVETFTIVVSPDSPGQKYLQIVNENHDLEIETVDRVPVYVRGASARSYGVPGIGIIQLLFLTMVSITFFSRGL